MPETKQIEKKVSMWEFHKLFWQTKFIFLFSWHARHFNKPYYFYNYNANSLYNKLLNYHIYKVLLQKQKAESCGIVFTIKSWFNTPNSVQSCNTCDFCLICACFSFCFGGGGLGGLYLLAHEHAALYNVLSCNSCQLIPMIHSCSVLFCYLPFSANDLFVPMCRKPKSNCYVPQVI